MTIQHLGKMFKPSSMALIRTRIADSAIGEIVVRNVAGAGFEGRVFLVDEGAAEAGEALRTAEVYPRIADLPDVPDLAVVVAPPEEASRIIRELGEKGTRTAVLMTPGRCENSPGVREMHRLRQAMLDAAKPYALRIIGPNTLGIMVPVISLNAGYAHIQPLSGWLAFVGQNDTMITSVLDWATHHRIGFSHFVSLGDMIDVDFGDMLDYLANDHHTRAVLLYVETVTHVRKFMSAARAASRMKPVIVFKGGRHADGKHGSTAGPMGSDAVFDAAFRRAGMLRVSTTQGLFDAAATLAALQSVGGDRLAVLTNSRGAGALALDSLLDRDGRPAVFTDETIEGLRKRLPELCSHENPLVLDEDAPGDRYAAALDLLMDDAGTDAVLALNCPRPAVSSTAVAQALIDVHQNKYGPYTRERHLLTSWIGQEAAARPRQLFTDHAIPTYETPDDAIRAFMRMVRYRRNQEMLMETPPNIPDTFTPVGRPARAVIGHALAQGRDRLTSREAMQLLEAYRIPTAKTGDAKSAEGGRSPWLSMPHTHELVIGMGIDPVFGPVIRFGHGGKAVDVIRDQAFALPPLNLHLAREVISRTRIFRLLKGFGDTPPVDLDGLALTLVKVSQMICDTAEIRELVLNPILADASGLTVLDTLVRIAPSDAPPAARLAIRPYPAELEETVEVKGGQRFMIRPIKPEDEPAFCELFDHLSREEIRLRFFRYMKTISHNLAARLTQIDYDRQMALVLTDPIRTDAETEMYGVVHVNMDPDNRTAEFAIMVRSDMTGRGLGSLLMRRIIAYCRRRGVGEIFGDVLRDNAPMLALSRSLGFSLENIPDEPGKVVVRLPLNEE